MSYGQHEAIGRKIKRNYDILLAVAGIVILPLMFPLESYIAYTYSSVYSGAASIYILLAEFALVITGLIARICRHLFGSGIN
jgi:hypothetical protein